MQNLNILEIKEQFPQIIEKVMTGETFGILKGRKKSSIAMIIPCTPKKEKKDRKIGILDGKVNIKFSDNFKITQEEFINLK